MSEVGNLKKAVLKTLSSSLSEKSFSKRYKGLGPSKLFGHDLLGIITLNVVRSGPSGFDLQPSLLIQDLEVEKIVRELFDQDSITYGELLKNVVPKDVPGVWEFRVGQLFETMANRALTIIVRYGIPYLEAHCSREAVLSKIGVFHGAWYRSFGCDNLSVPVLLVLTGQKEKAREVVLHTLSTIQKRGGKDDYFRTSYEEYTRRFMLKFFNEPIEL